MAKSTRNRKKAVRKVGRPKAGGAGSPMVVRMHKPQLKALDTWIGASDISRPEAIRQLVTWALAHGKTQAPVEAPINIVKRVRENEARRAG